MDRPRQNDHLGINKIGKNIRKSLLHQPSFAANANNNVVARPPMQPQVYNISKNNFKSIVQQLTGSPSREDLPQPPRNNSPKPQNTRLQKIRPAPLTQINRPTVPFPTMDPRQPPPHFVRPLPPQPPFPQGAQQQPMMGHRDQFWSNTVESPISEYMRYLQSSLGDSRPNGNQKQPGHEHQPHMPGHEHRPYMSPHEHRPYIPANEYQPYMPAQPQPQFQPQPQHQPQPQSQLQPQPQHQYQLQPQPQHQSQLQPQPQHQSQLQPQPQHQSQSQPHTMFGVQPRSSMQGPLQPNQFLPPPGLVPSPLPQNLSSPRFNGPVPSSPTLPSPRFNQIYGGFPSPRYNSFGPLHSPTSQFFLPSPSGYSSMFSPKSPYPLLSPGVQYPPPLTPNFSFSQIAQQGNLVPGAGPGPVPPQPPPSPGFMFPLSPSGFFPIPNPR